MVKGIAVVAVFKRVLVTGRLEMLGVVFSGHTVTAKLVLLDLAPLSVTHKVMSEEPVWAPADTVTVRLGPLPPSEMLPSGITDGSDDNLFNVRLLAASSASPMVN